MKYQMWILAVLVIATVALTAQQEPPASNPLGQPLVDAAGKVRDEAILRTPLVGGGADADYIGRDVRGKAVLLHDIPLPGDIRHTIGLEGSVARAFEKGAAAVGIVFGIFDNFAIWQAADARDSISDTRTG